MQVFIEACAVENDKVLIYALWPSYDVDVKHQYIRADLVLAVWQQSWLEIGRCPGQKGHLILRI